MTRLPAGVNNPPAAVRSHQIEHFLEERGLDYTIDLIPIASINREASLHNQARIEPIEPNLVERYRQADVAGAIFPSIIVGVNGNGGLTTADGNHRVESRVANGHDLIWAYVFEYNTELEFLSVSRTANAILNGKDNTLQERLMHAATFVERGVPVKDAAVQCGVSSSQIKTFKSAQNARDRFHALGLGARAYADLSDIQMVQLSGAMADGAVRSALALVRDGFPLKHVLVEAREAAQGVVVEADRAAAQVKALDELRKSKTTSHASVLARPKRDTIRLRLKGAVQVIGEIADRNIESDYQDELQAIRELVCR